MNLDAQHALLKLWNAGIKKEQIANLDVIVVPENLGSSPRNDLFDAQDAITLGKLLKSQGIAAANSFDLGFDLPTQERRSNEIWLGQLYIINDFVLPLVVGVIGSMLASSIGVWLKRKDNREPAGDVHVDLTVLREEGEVKLNYSGDPVTLMKILKTLEKKHDNGK